MSGMQCEIREDISEKCVRIFSFAFLATKLYVGNVSIYQFRKLYETIYRIVKEFCRCSVWHLENFGGGVKL